MSVTCDVAGKEVPGSVLGTEGADCAVPEVVAGSGKKQVGGGCIWYGGPFVVEDFAFELTYRPTGVTDKETYAAVDWITFPNVVYCLLEVAANKQSISVFACVWNDFRAESMDEKESVLTERTAAKDRDVAIFIDAVEELVEHIFGAVVEDNTCSAFRSEVIYDGNHAVLEMLIADKRLSHKNLSGVRLKFGVFDPEKESGQVFHRS